jgi:hypothetical protein
MVIMFSRLSIWKDRLFTYDKSGYHLYLPAIFIYNDLGKLSFYPDLEQQYNISSGEHWYALYEQQATGQRLNKYAIGNAVLETPFFLVAHAYAILNGAYAADGYSLPYQLAAFMGNILACIFGLLLLRIVLSRYYGDWTIFVTIVCIALGTNLFHQTAFDTGSHAWSFMLIAAVLFFSDNWHKHYKLKDACFLGITLGLVIITRPVDIIIALVPLLYGVYNKRSFKEQVILFRQHYTHIIIAFMMFLAVASIQMAYWKYITAHWIYFSYQGEGFDFTHPRVLDGLFSYRKGWFIYTPLMVLTIPGFFILFKKHKKWGLATVLFFIVALYITFSWENWWYGGGFAMRVMIDYYPLLAIVFAAFFSKMNASNSGYIRTTVHCIIILFISLNIFQTWQFSKGIIHPDRMSSQYYWRVFGKTNYSSEDLQYLMTDKEYWDEMRRIYN